MLTYQLLMNFEKELSPETQNRLYEERRAIRYFKRIKKERRLKELRLASDAKAADGGK